MNNIFNLLDTIGFKYKKSNILISKDNLSISINVYEYGLYNFNLTSTIGDNGFALYKGDLYKKSLQGESIVDGIFSLYFMDIMTPIETEYSVYDLLKKEFTNEFIMIDRQNLLNKII